ncbi:MAG: MmgE/PrpD family protein [Acidobacteriia bacterium]|nr:MmgE/PrpD family protein [Terriglobia bacterium]
MAQEPRVVNGKSGSGSMSRQFAQWVARLRYEDLPPAVVDRAKGLTLHALASALQGFQLPAGQEAIKLVSQEAGEVRGGATVLVSGLQTTKGDAAFANAELILAGGKWDTFRMLTHPGCSIVPAALAAAESTHASGRDFLTGLAAGYEVMERMAGDFIPTIMARGFHAGPVFGIFGAAVAAAKVMRSTEDQVNDAIALCVNMAAGNLESLGLREGPASRNAMLAVALARLGHHGGETALEGRAGLYQAYAGNNEGHLTYSFTGDTRTNLDKVTADLGARWMFLETLYRIYSITGYNLAHVDVTAKLCEEHNIRYEDVDHVEAVVNWLETQYPSPAFPNRREDIGEPDRTSTRYYAAYGVVTRGFPMVPVTSDPPEVLELMKRVTIIPSHQMTLFGPRITIFTKDGRSYTKQATGREFIWDFKEEARRIRGVIPGIPIPAAQFEELITTCEGLKTQSQVTKLVELTLKRS